MGSLQRIDIDKSLYDQSSFVGRFKHFMFITDPRTVFASDEELNNAKELVQKYRLSQEPKGTTNEQIVYAKKLYESAFHPDSGDLQNAFGRMSFQVPGGMAITGAMLQFYKTVPAVVFWQFVNQSFNALVNYTNRNANSPITTTQLGIAYVSATTSALVASLGYKSYLQKRSNPFFQRYAPFAAVAVANCVNIPLMRQNELKNGIDIEDENGNLLGKSRLAAASGITQVVISRIVMAAPGMIVLPVIMERLERREWFRRLNVLHAPFQTIMVGCFLIFMVPTACGLFPQRASLSTSLIQKIEPEFYNEIETNTKGNVPFKVYFNKGL
ncbi:CLUMA_CG003281, isoform A [Clunio marinus]|uniref:Sidoreflexin n=1 Tax=Clunio marinus TaxID=568069 RepID=A0A1J1HN73_9DIPT|nr:CLUMA_CG003281, isoform A [Clunio marinus]